MKTKMVFAVLAASLVFLPAASYAASPSETVTVKITSADGKDMGTVTLTEKKGGVAFKMDLMNLPPGEHAVHIHKNPKCEPPDYASSGPHFNPTGKEHGIHNPNGFHAGDIPLNLKVSADGTEKSSFVVKTISLDPTAQNSILANGGTSIVIHAGPDDMETDPGGESGRRIACGVIAPPGS